jgi:threonyl-tRNA synthetase
MPDGSERKGTSWQTTPMDVAKEVSKSLSERVVIAKVRPIVSVNENFLIAWPGGR